MDNLLADDPNQGKTPEETQRAELKAFIETYTSAWKEYKEANYFPRWREYDRMWRGIFSESDRTRESERSRIMTPLVQSAVDAFVSDINEAIFGPSGFFDVTPEEGTPPEVRMALEATKRELVRRYKADKVPSDIDAITQYAGVYGSGFGELAMDTAWDVRFEDGPGNRVARTKRYAHRLRPYGPFNILAPSNIQNIEDMPGIAVEEYVHKYTIQRRMANKSYRKLENIPTEQVEDALRLVQEDSYTGEDGNWVHIVRWFGRVPKNLLPSEKYNASLEPFDDEMVEAIVHIIGRSEVVFARRNPYVSQRRPIFHFPMDRVPGRFWGRGVPEKGFNMQKGSDATFRAHLDSLAFTGMPVTATDATKMPKGMNFKLYPGRNIVMNGDVDKAITRVDLGTTDPALLGTGEVFERHFMQATGQMDSAALPGLAKGGTDPLALQMALAGAVKKAKRSSALFQTEFLAPFIQESVWRLYQFEGDKFQVKGGIFTPVASLGILAREYENNRYISMLATLGPETPLVPLLVARIIRSSDAPDREKMAAQFEQIAQQKMEDKRGATAAHIQNLLVAAQLDETSAKTKKLLAEVRKLLLETDLLPVKTKAEVMASMTKNLPTTDGGAQFAQRVQVADLVLRERQIAATERQMDDESRQHDDNYALGVAQLMSNHSTKVHELNIKGRQQAQSKEPKE